MVFGIALIFLTFNTIYLVRDTDHHDYFGWVSIYPVGVGALAVVLLMFIFLIDILWVFFFLMWLVKKRTHIKDTDNTLYLP